MHKLLHVDIDNDTVSDLCEMLMGAAPENSRAVRDLRLAVHTKWPRMHEREAVLAKISKHLANMFCELLTVEAADGERPHHAYSLRTTMQDDTAGISFRTMLDDAIYTTVKGILDE